MIIGRSGRWDVLEYKLSLLFCFVLLERQSLLGDETRLAPLPASEQHRENIVLTVVTFTTDTEWSKKKIAQPWEINNSNFHLRV